MAVSKTQPKPQESLKSAVNLGVQIYIIMSILSIILITIFSKIAQKPYLNVNW